MKRTAKWYIVRMILELAKEYDEDIDIPDDDCLLEYWDDYRIKYDDIQAAIVEFSCSGEATSLSAPESIHYEAEQVARPIPGCDNLGVSWTYWYGGGRHGEPESIEYIDDSFLVKYEESVVRKYEKMPIDNKE